MPAAGGRMRRIGVAVEKFDSFVGRRIHNGVIHLIGDRDTTHWNGAVSKGLSHRDDVWFDVKFLRGKRCPHAAKASDDFVIQ